MDIEKSFHMTGGTGPTSYTQNSTLQKKGSDKVKHLTMETLQQLYVEMVDLTSIGIADLGCSSGSNTLSTIKEMVEFIEGTSRKILRPAPPEFHFFLNDLPTNDFNSVFKALPDFYREIRKDRSGGVGGGASNVFVAGYPGSFYGRLFPNNMLHFVYSSYSLHWLSKVPPGLYNEEGESINKGSIYISESSPPGVTLAYFRQFQEDFSLFLGSRSQEMLTGGRMVLILLGRVGPDHVDRGNSFLWQLLSRSLAILVSQGATEREKLHSYEVHFYAPSREEIEEEMQREGSFGLDRFEMFEIERENHGQSYGSVIAMTVRAIQESMIRHHFHLGDESLDTLFDIYGKMVDEEMAKMEIKPITFVLVLRKL